MWKVHPFLSIMITSLVLALLAGIPLPQVPKVIGDGFSSTFTSIGIVIILGALIGTILEKTGAALTLADVVIRLVGERRPGLALELMGVLFPFLVAALFKSAQGSSTVAITTTAGLMAPLLPALGLVSPAEITLGVLAIGAGAMTVSHANDSYFWVVTRFGGLSVEDGYKAHTMTTLVMGLASIIGIFIIRLFM